MRRGGGEAGTELHTSRGAAGRRTADDLVIGEPSGIDIEEDPLQHGFAGTRAAGDDTQWV